jgi:hypothetical protein
MTADRLVGRIGVDKNALLSTNGVVPGWEAGNHCWERHVKESGEGWQLNANKTRENRSVRTGQVG